MPKEVTANSQLYSSEFPDETLQVEVRWSREAEHVQIATVVVKAADHSLVEKSVHGGWFIDLNRPAINKLIRDLRRARDQAFGKDE